MGLERGDAGSGFSDSMGSAATAVDGLAVDFGATARALDTHADDLDTVTSRMNQAVDIARAGGLRTTGDTIFEPGPAPAEPAALPTTRPATEAEQSMHAQATATQGAYVRQVVAYPQAGEVVVAARGIETASQRALNSFLAGFGEKLPFTITDFATGLAGAVAARTSTLRQSRPIRRQGRPRRSPARQRQPEPPQLAPRSRAARGEHPRRTGRARRGHGRHARPPSRPSATLGEDKHRGEPRPPRQDHPHDAIARQCPASADPYTGGGYRDHSGRYWIRHHARIAVGTALAGGPPRRSQRVLLTHWAPALGSGVEARVRERVSYAGGW